MKTTFILFTFVLFTIAGFGQDLSKQEWLADLETYKTGLEEKHINMYNKISKADFEKEWNDIRKTAEQKSDIEISIELMRLTRKIGDGHTAISLRNLDTHEYPLALQYFNGTWKTVAISEEFKRFLGMELVGINEHPIYLVAEKVSEIAQFVENEYSQIVRTAQNLTNAELLHGLGISPEKTTAVFTFKDETGKLTSQKLASLNQTYYNETNFSRIKIGVSEVKIPENQTNDGFWFAPITGTNGLLIHFESYPSFEKMMLVGEEIVAYIFQNNIQELVIDMRNNGGGDLYTGLVLAYALNLADPIDWKSGVYVLCDNVTFSAATSNTILFRELLNAKIVGEPTGSNPTGYQDMDTFELPNSKLVVSYSKRLFRIQETPTSGVLPDILLKYEWKSFSKGKDNMLEWIIKEIKK